jgi:hypothetical protein
MPEDNIKHNNANAASSEVSFVSSTPQPEASKPKNGLAPTTSPSLRSLTQFVYICQGLSFFFGLTAIVGICVNYLKRDAVKGTIIRVSFFVANKDVLDRSGNFFCWMAHCNISHWLSSYSGCYSLEYISSS